MKKKRIAYIDQIKAFLCCLVVAHHAGQAYGSSVSMWLVRDNAQVDFLSTFFYLNASFMMALFFFISGYFTAFSLKKKKAFPFIRQRMLRLGVPLLFFSLAVILPVNYLLADSGESPLRFFIHSYFKQPPMAVWHLWFLALLLLFSLICLLLFRTGIFTKIRLPQKFKIGFPLLFIVFLTIIQYPLRIKYPIDFWQTWLVPIETAHLLQYFSMFVMGIIFYQQNWLEELDMKRGSLFFFSGMLFFAVRKISLIPAESLLIDTFTESALCVGTSMGVIALFRAISFEKNRLFLILADNAFGIYILHMFVVISLQKIILHWTLPGQAKFLLVTAAGIAISLILSCLLRMIPAVKKFI